MHAGINDLNNCQKLNHLLVGTWQREGDQHYVSYAFASDVAIKVAAQLSESRIAFTHREGENGTVRFLLTSSAALAFIENAGREQGGFHVPSKEDRICATLMDRIGGVWTYRPAQPETTDQPAARGCYVGSGISVRDEQETIRKLNDAGIDPIDDGSELGVRLLVSTADADRFAARSATTGMMASR